MIKNYNEFINEELLNEVSDETLIRASQRSLDIARNANDSAVKNAFTRKAKKFNDYLNSPLRPNNKQGHMYTPRTKKELKDIIERQMKKWGSEVLLIGIVS